jgi:hypothetical protein
MKDVATGLIEAFIKSEKERKRKQIYSVTLDQELYVDAMIVANRLHDGNFSKCVTVALEEYIDREVAKGIALIQQK